MNPEGSQTEYKARVREEIEHYNKIYESEEARRTLTQSVPPSWHEMEARAQELIRARNNGRSVPDEIVAHLQAKGGGRVLSIGSGPGGQEIEIARRLGDVSYEFICLDINPNLVEMGQQRADSENLHFKFRVQDINELVLGEEEYDVIMCFASLHHLINLEGVFNEINKALKDDGELVVVDIVTRNGYLMWEQTLQVVQAIWSVLPEKFKYNHTSYEQPRPDLVYENLDYGSASMECARSEDILPLLEATFERKILVPYFSIVRRFFDTKYGPNYDLSKTLDKSILDMLWNLDMYYISAGLLKPETVFAVYTRGDPTKFPQADSDKASAVIQSGAGYAPDISQPIASMPLQPDEWEEFRVFLSLFRAFRGTWLYRLLKRFIR